ncbi:MAG: NAD(P)H-binding protein [Pseudomonadota bacterium]
MGAQTLQPSGPVVVAGASGTIGRAVAARLLSEGRETVCLLRAPANAAPPLSLPELAGARIEQVELDDRDALMRLFGALRPAAVISCIASRSGGPRDAWKVDHDANCAMLAAAEASGAKHFVLLSAICVQKPRLAFQHAKLAFEAKLAASPIAHTIVRPTAFFKSLSGQVGRVEACKPFLLFGDGELTRCKPISDADCARFIVDCLTVPDREGQILPIGGPGPAISLREQGELLFELAGREPRFKSVPVALFDWASALLSMGERWSQWCSDKAEYARIAKYYATESMLLLDPDTGEYSAQATPEFGSDTLRDHYAALLAEHRNAKVCA